MPTEKDHLYHRDFLNDPGFHSTAFMYIDLEFHRERGNVGSITGTVCLSDCSRQIDLNFDAYDEEARQHSIRKVAKIIEQLQRVEQFLRDPKHDLDRIAPQGPAKVLGTVGLDEAIERRSNAVAQEHG